MCIIDGDEELLCFESFAQAQQSCSQMLGDGVVGGGPVTCDNQSADTSPDWSPQKYVTYRSNTQRYEINSDFFDSVLKSPDQLLQDSARLAWHGDHFEFESIITGDLADVLGFEDGDVLAAVNGYPISTMAEAVKAFDALYGSQELTVALFRSTEPIILHYQIKG